MLSSLIGKSHAEVARILGGVGWRTGERFYASDPDSNYSIGIWENGVALALSQSPNAVVAYVDTYVFDKDPRNGLRVVTGLDDSVIAFGEPYLDKGDWLSDLAGALLPSLAFSFAAPFLGAAISGALGTSQAIGASLANIGLATATNGGDVESAIKSALVGGVSGSIGSYAGAAADSALVSKLTSVTVATAIKGGDIQGALTGALLLEGAGAAGGFLDNVLQPAAVSPLAKVNMNDYDSYGSADAAFADPLQQFSQLDLGINDAFALTFDSPLMDEFDTTNFADAALFPSIDPMSGTAFQIDPTAFGSPIATEDYADNDLPGYGVVPISAEDYADNDLPGYGGDQNSPTFEIDPNPDAGVNYSHEGNNYPQSAPSSTSIPGAGNSYTFAEGLRAATSLAMAAIQVSSAYQSAQRPASIPAGARVSTAGNTVTGQSDGNVTVRTPAGKVSVQKPPVGVPYTMANGGVVVNNGDGTYTVASAAGSTVTRAYASTASAGASSSKALLFGGAAVVGLLLLSK